MTLFVERVMHEGINLGTIFRKTIASWLHHTFWDVASKAKCLYYEHSSTFTMKTGNYWTLTFFCTVDIIVLT